MKKSKTNKKTKVNKKAQTKTAPKKDESIVDLPVKVQFPDEYPFWARLKISKNRTTLVIDEEMILDKTKKGKLVEGFVHREATSIPSKNTEEIKPNPDKSKKEPMNLKRPRKLPKELFKPHNKNLDMPDSLKKRYGKNKKNK